MTTAETYITIPKQGEGLYKEKGSKFIAYAIPVQTVEEVKNIIKEYQKQYHDARHVCYAYMLGADREEYRANDDGEPSGTAGRPILGQINSRNLTNILVIVIRYFGGILLGTGGLIVAYKQAASEALDNAGQIEKIVEITHNVFFNYQQMNDIMRIIKEEEATIINNQFHQTCQTTFTVPKAREPRLIQRMKDLRTVKIE